MLPFQKVFWFWINAIPRFNCRCIWATQAAVPHSSLPGKCSEQQAHPAQDGLQTPPWPHSGCITGNYPSTKMRLNVMKAFRFKTGVSSHLKSDGRHTYWNLCKRLVSIPVPDELRGRTQRHPESSEGKAELLATGPAAAGGITQPLDMAAAQRKKKASRAAGTETAK